MTLTRFHDKVYHMEIERSDKDFKFVRMMIGMIARFYSLFRDFTLINALLYQSDIHVIHNQYII